MLKAIVIAGLSALSLAALPAAAQTAADDQRFRAAQDRFDREYQAYRQEVARYQAATSRGGGYQPQGYDDAPRPYDNGGSGSGGGNSGGYRVAPDPYANDDTPAYDPARDYRGGTQYQERVLSSDERVYAGYDGRYYCRRNDGTTGLIVGGAAGGVLGNVIDGGRSRTVGTLLGAAAGALAGRAVDQNRQQVRCR